MFPAVQAGASNQLLPDCHPFEPNIQKGGKKLSTDESQVLARSICYLVNAGDVKANAAQKCKGFGYMIRRGNFMKIPTDPILFMQGLSHLRSSGQVAASRLGATKLFDWSRSNGIWRKATKPIKKPMQRAEYESNSCGWWRCMIRNRS
jgi:hypothetical protein